MTARKQIAAAILLAGMTVLAGCGDDGARTPNPAAATQAARTQLAEFKSAWEKCDGRDEQTTCADLRRINNDPARPEACRSGAHAGGVTITDDAVRRCADALRTAPTAAPSTTAAPATPAQASPSHGIGSAIGGLLSTLLSLAMGFLCIFGIPGLIMWVIYRRVRADRRERAHAQSVHREEGSWQEDTPSPYIAPDEPDHNPWA